MIGAPIAKLGRPVRVALRLARGVLAGLGLLAAFAFLLGAGLLVAGCALTGRLVDKTILSSPEMKFDYLDQDRDLADITGSVLGGGGGGGGGC